MEQKKIDAAIKLLQTTCGDQEVELCYSGGKDSDVILELAKMAGIRYRAIYKNTTIDPPGTIQHCRANGVEVRQPSVSFLKLIERKGFPTRRARFCCEKLKEYKIMDKAIQGIRREESTKRAALYHEPTMCRFYGSKSNHVEVILPILDWTNQDVADFIQLRKIQLHPLYYREDGTLDVTKRLGCCGCPMKSDNGLSDFKRNPRMVKAWLRAGKKWWDNHPSASCHQKYESIYDLFVSDIFFHSYLEFKDAISGGVFGYRIDCKQFLEEYFKIEL